MNDNDPFSDFDRRRDEGFGDAPRQGMSTGFKVFIGVLIFIAVSLLICCGGAYWLFSRSVTLVEDPAEVNAIRDSIASIELPEGFKPMGGMQFNLGIQLKMATFTRESQHSPNTLILMQISGSGIENNDALREQFEQQLEKQGQTPDIDAESRETHIFQIDGKDVPFEFAKGTREGSEEVIHQVSGMFDGRGGVAFLILMESEADWNEDEVIKMIESISTKSSPGPASIAPEEENAAPTDSPTRQ